MILTSLKQKLCKHDFDAGYWEHGFSLAAGWDNKITTCKKCKMQKIERVNLAEKYASITKSFIADHAAEMDPLEDHPVNFYYGDIYETICNRLSIKGVCNDYRKNKKISFDFHMTPEMNSAIHNAHKNLTVEELVEFKKRLFAPIKYFLTSIGWESTLEYGDTLDYRWFEIIVIHVELR